MRFLHIIGSVDPSFGGPIEGIVRQAEVLRALGHDREIVSLDPPDADFLKEFPLKVYPLGASEQALSARQSWIPWKYYLYSPKLVPWLKENVRRYDVVVVNGLWNYSAFGASRVLRKSPVPYFVFTHGMLDPWFRRTYPLKHLAKQIFWFFSEGPLLHNARCVFFTTEDERRLARGQFVGYSYRERVIPYGTSDVGGDSEIQIAAFRKALPSLKDRPFLLFLSRIHRKKGCDLLLRAFKDIAKSMPDLDLVMAGPDQVGLRPKLELLAAKLGIAGRVHWPGMLSGDVKFGAFRAAEAFVLPSHQENFGIVVAEAMACGKPVLITNKVNIWREVVAGGAGLASDDCQGPVNAMLRTFFSMSMSARQKMGEAARTCFLKQFEAAAAVASFVKAVQGLR